MDRILKTHFDNFRDKGELPPELQELNGEVKLFDNKELLEEWRNNKKGNKLIVLDYKTRGFPLKEDTHEHYQNQLDIYNFLLRKNSFETEDYSYLLFYHPDKVNGNGDVVFNTDMKIKNYGSNAYLVA